MPVPDISGDGLADVDHRGAARTGRRAHAGHRGGALAQDRRGALEARPRPTSENLGWDLTLAGDQDGDGHTDLFVGAPAEDSGRVYLLSGKDGTVLRTYAPREEGGSFGWYVARLDDLDGDGRADLAVGAPFARGRRRRAGRRRLGRSRRRAARSCYHWKGTDRRGGFGEVVAAVGDLDGDGKGEIAVAAPATEDQTRTLPGELRIYSGAHREGAPALVGQVSRASCSDGWSSAPAISTATASTTSPSARPGIVARPATGSVVSSSAPGGAATVLAELFGDEADCWFGWHIRRAPDPDGRGRPALLIGSLRHPVDGQAGRRRARPLRAATREARRDHGTITRGARRSDIR